MEDLYVAYMKKSMAADEIVEAVEVPLRRDNLRYRAYKISKRYDSDISAVCAAFAIWLDGARIERAQLRDLFRHLRFVVRHRYTLGQQGVALHPSSSSGACRGTASASRSRSAFE